MLESFFDKVADLKALRQHRCFPVNIPKLLRTLFLQNTSDGSFCTVQRVLRNFLMQEKLFDFQ